MAKLKTDYLDDILSESMNGKRRYTESTNSDSTISFTDSTSYDQTGDSFGAGDINATNTAVNGMMYVEVTLSSSGWSSSAPYTQTVAVANMTEDWVPGNPVLASSGSSSTDIAILEAYTYVSAITSSEGYLTFTCYEDLPTVSMTVRIPGMVSL